MDDLSHVEPVEIILGVVLLCHLRQQEVILLQVVLVDFPAFQHQPGLLKDHIAPFCLYGSQSGLGDLIVVPSRTGATELKDGAVLFGKKGERVVGIAVGKAECVALRADVSDGYRQVPQDSQVAPAGGHSVHIAQPACGDQHPVFVQQFEYVVGDLGGLDGMEVVHGGFRVGKVEISVYKPIFYIY